MARTTVRSRLSSGLAIASLFVATYAAARILLELEIQPAVRVLIALLPIPPFALWLVTAVRAIRQSDELELRIHLEALAVAFPLALLLLLTLGLLEIAIELSPADWSYRHVWPMVVVFYFVGLAIARRRYQ